jgi:hypothetical protein
MERSPGHLRVNALLGFCLMAVLFLFAGGKAAVRFLDARDSKAPTLSNRSPHATPHPEIRTAGNNGDNAARDLQKNAWKPAFSPPSKHRTVSFLPAPAWHGLFPHPAAPQFVKIEHPEKSQSTLPRFAPRAPPRLSLV